PICNPQLPPPMLKNAGALQPFAVLHEATPTPPSPPKMNPPLSRLGTTAMHFALSRTSLGMPLSGAAIIASSTWPAFCRRLATSCFSLAAQQKLVVASIASNTASFFINLLLFFFRRSSIIQSPGAGTIKFLDARGLRFVLGPGRQAAAVQPFDCCRLE